MNFLKFFLLTLVFSVCAINCQFAFSGWMNHADKPKDKFVKVNQLITESCLNITQVILLLLDIICLLLPNIWLFD